MTPVQLPEVPALRDCVAFRWEGDPINEASDAPWKYASHWSTPPWNHRPVECLYTAAQLREYATSAVLADRERVAALSDYYRELEKLSDFTPSETNSER